MERIGYLRADAAAFLRSRSGLAFFVFAAFAAALATAVGLGFYRSHLLGFERNGTAEQITAIQIADAFVSVYSDVRSAGMNASAPVPATYRAHAIERFNQGRDAAGSLRILMVGVPGREIRTAPQDAQMAEAVRALAARDHPEPFTGFVTVGDRTTLRTIYPSVATHASCAACHNQLQPAGAGWQVGAVMGAYAVDTPAGEFIAETRREAVTVAAAVFVLMTAIGCVLFLVQYRRMRHELAAAQERERAHAAARAQAEAASRAKSAFLALVSHELRTPLNAINGFSQMMADEVYGKMDPKYRDYAADIRDSGRQLLAVINDILDLSKAEAGEIALNPGPIEVAAFAEDCVAIVRERADDNALTIAIDVAPGVEMWADELRLRQVAVNLLDNAVKFTPAGGAVSFTARHDGDGVVLRVADTGIGIAAADIAKAFDPFGQVDSALNRKFQGTGLGLPLSKALVGLHGGTLTLESAPGQGTTVTVRLPDTAEPAFAAAERMAAE
ncbi:MAG: hypothetical protein JNL66_15125 [Alphaproteobacteria bacterium]|nr:hypothetical protein [Alphaproteobacteria bacterium]